MPALSRLGDITIGIADHGLDCCPHTVVGVRISGSPDTKTNNQDTSRVTDIAVHTCPHCAINMCVTGSPNVITNNLQDHRVGDVVTEFCGVGNTVTGSPDTFDNG